MQECQQLRALVEACGHSVDLIFRARYGRIPEQSEYLSALCRALLEHPLTHHLLTAPRAPTSR